ncbi:MAG: DUF434 domain-containing protein [Bradymonadia bacterium]
MPSGHRGAHPQDAELFHDDQLPNMRQAVADLGWLLERGYAPKSSLKLVGDRYALHQRQRIAVSRCTCPPTQLAHRLGKRIPAADLTGAVVHIDGLNVLTSIEAALGGGVLLQGPDGVVRDMASMHGNYRKVHETLPAATLIGEQLEHLGVSKAIWWLDRPVSNTGRLKTLLYALATERRWQWQVELVVDPDPVLIDGPGPVLSADSRILDEGSGWFDVVGSIVRLLHQPWLVQI